MQTTDAPPAADDAPPTPQEPVAPTSTPEPRFFRWIRSLDLVRRDGWLGGVCAAVAARVGVDVILVRGVVVVLAALGAPVVLVYAAAWLLLPDATGAPGAGAIHALRLRRGKVDGPVLGIGLLVLASFLPLTQGFWWVGAAYWGEPDVAASIGRIVWTAVVIVVAVVAIVWLARRGRFDAMTPDAEPVAGAADADPAASAAASSGSVADVGAESEAGASASDPAALDTTTSTVIPATTTATGTTSAAVPEPPAAPSTPGKGASDAELAAWREQQNAWREHRSAWAEQQKREDRARRLAAQEEGAAARRAQALARRRREPGAGAAYIGGVLGLAVVAGCLAAIAVTLQHPDRAAGWLGGFGAATAVFGLGLALAGVLRRRARTLALFAILTLVAAAASVPFALRAGYLPPGASYGIDTSRSGSYTQLAGGSTEFWVSDYSNADADIELTQRGGGVAVNLDGDRTVRIIASIENGTVSTSTYNGNGTTTVDGELSASSVGGDREFYDVTIGDGAPDLTLHLTLVDASVGVQSFPGNDPTPAPSTSDPTPTATLSTEGTQP